MELLLLFLVVALVLPIWMASRARRRAREAAEQLEYDTDQAREGGDGNGRPPSLFDLFMGPGTWARSYEFDPETGQWVDVLTDRRSPFRHGMASRTRSERSRRSAAPVPVQRPTRLGAYSEGWARRVERVEAVISRCNPRMS